MKKRTMIICVVLLVFCVVGYQVYVYTKTAESYLLHSYGNFVEVIYQECIEGNKEVVFFTDDEGYILCAILERRALGYKTLRISGMCSLSRPGYICSYYYVEDESNWIAWGLVTDKKVTTIVADEKEMKICEAGAYTFRICWLLGTGTAPICFTEEYAEN